jgi:hypothetical protein
MKSKTLFLLGMMAAAVASMFAATHQNYARWTGVWQGELDGQPGVTLTLTEENGQLGGQWSSTWSSNRTATLTWPGRMFIR